ncbi:MAG: hypothetical protein GIX03_02070 [Candidatus Eremiobacteraeota bacterium]|nr:hypothetical protein [Candidatus Eremiobacteraeota bacterium]MBC5801805.1 hypothetical protein [Candidatus Eremiobacteraeota bacterium]MBC5823129.1 hypothetical protein [Candidatus Eremiobacteraeota bacterium]
MASAPLWKPRLERLETAAHPDALADTLRLLKRLVGSYNSRIVAHMLGVDPALPSPNAVAHFHSTLQRRRTHFQSDSLHGDYPDRSNGMRVQRALLLTVMLSALVFAPENGALAAPADPQAPIAPANRTIRQALEDSGVRASFTRPIRQLAEIAWMSGMWKGRVIRHIGPHRETKDAAAYVFATTLNGRWMFGTDRAGRDNVYITYDPLGKQWTLVRLDANPSYGMFVSREGWRSGRITFESVAAFADGQPYRRTTTILQRNARSFVIYDKERPAAGTDLLDDIISLTKR